MKSKIRTNKLLKGRLTKSEYLAHQILVGLAAVYVFYCRFTRSGPVNWLDSVQSNILDGEYYPVLSLLLGLVLFIVPITGLFLLYTQLSPSKSIQTAAKVIPFLRESVYLQVRNANTLEALALLEKTGNPDVQLIKDQFQRVLQDFLKGVISFDSFSIAQARIHQGILRFTSREGRSDAGKAAVHNGEVRKLAEEGDLEAALQLLLPTLEEDATLLLSQLHSTREYYLLGLVNEEQLGRLKSKIKFAILELAR